jgi:1,4-dihydroxy-2-naphthoate octaprenyltransferase
VNLANDYFDHKSGNDELNQHPTPFSGGSRVIQDGIIDAQHIKWAFLLCLAAGALVGLYLNSFVPGNVILYIGLAGMAIGVFYSAPPFAASYRRLGEIFVAIGFGPLIVVGAYYVQTGTLHYLPLLASIPIAILIMLVLFLNQFPDFEADKKALKRNWVNTLGKEKSVRVLRFFLLTTYIIMAVGIILKIFPPLSALVFLTIPHAIITYDITRKNFDKILELIPANAEMVTLNFLFGVLFTAAFVLQTMQGSFP